MGVDLVQGYLLARPGEGWPEPRHWRTARTSVGTTDSGSSGSVGSLRERVERMVDPHDAADEVTAHLYENFAFLPSVYVERAGVLRFLSGRGQWQVLDGIEPGVGLTGSAFAAGEPVLVQDVTSDPRYREAVPGVVAELAVPLTVNRHIVGVLNVDAPAFIDAEQVEAVQAAAGILEQAFSRTGISSYRGSPLSDFGWHAPRVAQSRTVGELAQATVCAGVDIAHLQSAMLWTALRRVPGPAGHCRGPGERHRQPVRRRARAAGQPGLPRRLELQHRTGDQPDLRAHGPPARPRLRHRVRRRPP